MRYSDFKEGIWGFEQENWFGEIVYFETLSRLRPFGLDTERLTKDEVEGVIRMFLLQWGQMARAINRKDTDWNQMLSKLKGISNVLKELGKESILNADLESKKELILEAYGGLHCIKHFGATSIPKILHLLNPELFVMWDERIRANENNRLGFDLVDGEPQKFTKAPCGYLKYLRACQDEARMALEEGKRTTSDSLCEVLRRLLAERPEVEPEKLGSKYSCKTLAKLIDEYNWWRANRWCG